MKARVEAREMRMKEGKSIGDYYLTLSAQLSPIDCIRGGPPLICDYMEQT